MVSVFHLVDVLITEIVTSILGDILRWRKVHLHGLMRIIGYDYPHLITVCGLVDQAQNMLSWMISQHPGLGLELWCLTLLSTIFQLYSVTATYLCYISINSFIWFFIYLLYNIINIQYMPNYWSCVLSITWTEKRN